MASPFLGDPSVAILPDWFVALTLGTVVSVLVALFGWRSVHGALRTLLVVVGTSAQIACDVLMIVAPVRFASEMMAGACAGVAIGLLWVCWFSVLRSVSSADVEDIFSASLGINAVCFILAVVLPSMLRFALFAVLAFLQLGAFLLLAQTQEPCDETAERSLFEGGLDQVTSEDRAGVVRVFAGCVAAFAFISFAGAGLASLLEGSGIDEGLLFSLGILLGVGALRLFIRFSPRVDVFESVRWIFPVVGFALAMSASGSSSLLGAGVVMAALSHIAFEGMTRIGIASLAKSSGFSFMQVGALGMTSISLGALLGALAFSALQCLTSSTQTLFSFALALLSTLVLVLFGGREGAGKAETAPLAENEACEVMARRFALSPRETEVLGYLIEGRSSPYIRDQLVISKSTVDTHVRHIYEKSGVASRQELITLFKEIRG